MSAAATEVPAVIVPQGIPQGDRITGTQEITVLFGPHGGLPVKVTFFCAGEVFGVGVYPESGSGVVLRWHDGPAGDPRVIYWHSPHCADDKRGSPCELEPA